MSKEAKEIIKIIHQKIREIKREYPRVDIMSLSSTDLAAYLVANFTINSLQDIKEEIKEKYNV